MVSLELYPLGPQSKTNPFYKENSTGVEISKRTQLRGRALNLS